MTAQIIAELSSNHNGDLCRCLDMIVAAKKCGCWAAKFQFYRPEDLPDFDRNVNLPIPLSWLPHMLGLGDHWNIVVFASVFGPWAASELKAQGVKYFKIASPESTRLSNEAYQRIRDEINYGTTKFVSAGLQDFRTMRAMFYEPQMLYCKAGYPATIDADDIAFVAKNAVGFSDHTADIIAPLAMIGAGAKYIEKHFKLDDNCPDANFSLNPDQMKMLCDLAK